MGGENMKPESRVDWDKLRSDVADGLADVAKLCNPIRAQAVDIGC